MVTFIRDATEQRAAQEALRLNDARLRSIVESIGEYAIYLLDREGHVLTWNPGAERIKGYKADEVLGLHYSRFFTQEDVEQGRPAELLRQAIVKNRVEEEGWRVRKDGSRFWANVVLTAIHDSTGAVTGFSKVTRDVTEHKQAQESVIAELSSLLLANVDIRKLLAAFTASIRQMVPHDAATLALYEEPTGKLRVQFLATGDTDANQGEVLLDPDASPAGQAFRTRRPVILNKIGRWPFAPESVQHLIGMGMQSGVWVPLVHRERTLGTVMVASRLENAFSQHDAEMLAQVAGQVAMAVNNAMAFKQIAELRDRLTQEKQYLEDEINLEHRFEDIVGESTGPAQRAARDCDRCAHRCHRAHPGRDGNRQRTAGARHPSPEPAQRAHLYQAELRGHSRRPARERALRPREGRVHRRHRAQNRPPRAGARRHALSRRGGRAAARSAAETCCAPCRSARSSASAARGPSPSMCA